MIVQLLMLASYPLALLLTIAGLVVVVTLLRRRLHPLRILTHALVGAALIGAIGILGVVPSSLWWLTWILPVLLLGAVVLACWRLLATEPRSGFTRRQTTLLRRPHPALIIAAAVLFAAVSLVPLVWP